MSTTTTTPCPPELPAAARRHNTGTMMTAKRMHATVGWSPTQIARYLTSRGTPVAVSTVREWVIPEAEDKRRARQRQPRRNARTAALLAASPDLERSHQWSPEKRAHLLELGLQFRRDGMPYPSIVHVFARYEGASITEHGLRKWLTSNGAPRNPLKARALEARRASEKAASDIPHEFFDAARGMAA